MGTFFAGLIVFAIIGLAGYNVYKSHKRKKGHGCDSCSCCSGSFQQNNCDGH